MEAITVEAGRNLTLQQGLGTRTGDLRTGSSTHALVEQVRRRSNMLHHVRRDAADIQVLLAAEVAPSLYYWRSELGLKGVQLFA